MSALHIIGFPHTQTTSAYPTCAYTSKIVKLCRMLHGRGRPIFLYAGEENEAPCDEHIPLVSSRERERWFGPNDQADLSRGGFDFEPSSPWWLTMNNRAAHEIRKRRDGSDLLLISMGQSQQLVADALPELTAAEWGVGYEGIITDRVGGPCFAAYESSSHMHYVHGLLWERTRAVSGHRWNDGRVFDDVIPNFFDPGEFPVWQEKPGGYLLFVGRLIARKGLNEAAAISRETGVPLRVAGPGMTEHGPGFVRCADGVMEAPGLEYVGVLDIAARNRMMAGALCLLAPTQYLEPFGGVAVEAMLSGCPAVTTDWGAFRETVDEGVTGFRFRTVAEGCEAVRLCGSLDRGRVREHALSRFSLDAVAPRYERWFARLESL